MDFGVLGALSVTDGGRPLALGGPVQRRLLAALIAHAPDAVSSDVLVDDVWGEQAPATAVRTLHSHIARLRANLGHESHRTLETIDGRYRLTLERGAVDAWVFEDLVHTATSNGASPSEAAAMLRNALSLWRGPAYAEFVGAPFADAEGRRLESLREHACESAIEADLASGMGAELVPELEALVVEHPFRERLWSALVVALYRAGRQADALEAYQRARAVLGDELGVDPGPELRSVEARVLAQDPSLLVATPARVPTCPWKGLAAYEPGDVDFFVGRDVVISEVIARLVDYSVVIVTGPSGSGKSSLVRAGVIPALADGAIIGSAAWKVSLLSPGSQPLDAIRAAVADSPDLLVIDPGDDLLAVSGADVVGLVAEALRGAISRGTRIVMTLRGDLYGRLTEITSLAPRASAGTVLVGPPRDEDLRKVVELPARRVGLDVEPALVDAVVSDVSGRPASLPLLSTALVRTWERRDGNRLTLAGYVAAGGTASALERLAEEAYAAMGADEQVAARRLLLRLVVNDDGLWRRRRLLIEDAAPPGDDPGQRALQSLSDHRLVSIDVGEVQLSHEALTVAWPRFASWLDERKQTAGVVDHLTTAASAWQAGGRDDADLYRGARLQAALDLEASLPDELGAMECEFIAASRAAADREITTLRRGRRRLMVVAAGLVLLLVLATLAGALAVRSRNDAAQAAQEADAQRVGLEALNRTDASQKLLLAVTAVRLHDNAGTQASLLAALQSAAGSAATTVPLTAPAQAVTVSSDGWIAVAESNGYVRAYPPDLAAVREQAPANAWSRGTPTNRISWLGGHDAVLVGASDPARLFSMNTENGGVSLFAADWDPDLFSTTGDRAWVVGSRETTGTGITLVAQRVDAPTTTVRLPRSTTPVSIVPGPGTTVTVIDGEAVQHIDVANARVLATAPVPPDALVVASAGGGLVAAALPDGTVELIDLTTQSIRRPIPTLDAPLVEMSLSPDGSLLAGAGAREAVIRVWDTTTGVERAAFASTFGRVLALAWAPDGSRLYSAPAGVAALQAWNLSSYVSPARPVTAARPGGAGLTTTTAVDPTTRTVAVGTDLGRPWFLDLDSGATRLSAGPKRPPIVSVAFVDEGRLALTADALGVLALWDPATGNLVVELSRPTRSDSPLDVSRAAVSPDGRTAASFIDGYGLQLVDTASRDVGPPVYPDLGTQSMYQVLGWSPDGRFVVVGAQGIRNNPTTGSTPGIWALVDPREGRVVWRTPAPEQVVAADAVFAEGGRTIVLPGESGRLYFVDAATGELHDPAGAAAARPPAVNSRQTPASLSVSPDGTRLSVVSQAHPVEIWDVTTARQSGTIEVPPETINAHFLSDGELVTATDAGAVTVHDLAVADWIRLACRGAGRELTTIEWGQFLPNYPYRTVCANPDEEVVS